MDAFASDVVTAVKTAFEGAQDPARAAAMAAYMRSQFPFLGIPSAVREPLERAAAAELRPPDEKELGEIALAFWGLPEREYQYFACGYVIRHVRGCASTFLPTARRLITTKSWWDTVDALASRVVGVLVRRDPSLGAEMDRWVEDDNLWVRRTAIIHQLGAKGATDAERLFRYCSLRAAEKDFFIRKAIGWALREYSKRDATAVREFVEDHGDKLSALSRREGLKWLERRAAPVSP